VAGESLLKRLDELIARCDTEIVRIKAESHKAVEAQKGQKDIFQKARLMLVANPDAEALLLQLAQLGLW
jgi:hypothetical protein